MISKEHPLPLTTQAKLLGLPRSTVYYRPVPVSSTELAIMATMDEIHTKWPFYGIRRIRDELLKRGFRTGRRRSGDPHARDGDHGDLPPSARPLSPTRATKSTHTC